MNKKKGITIIAAIEALILFLLCLLYVGGKITHSIFIALLVVVAVITSTAVLLIAKKQ